ncbi:MAG: RIO1 family regulatory kinase/ATPase domain-containing protein [Chloroflexota bacterium]
MSVTNPLRAWIPDWPDGEPYEDLQRGTLKSGKEAEIFLVERRFARSGPRLLAHKRYRIRYPGKDELRAEGFSNATSFRRHALYREGWNVGARDRRALAAGNKSRHGQELGARMWPIQEWAILRRAWDAGVSVPYPVEQTEDGMLMEYIGDESRAAPKLVQARLGADALASAWTQLSDNLRNLTAAGLVHADLSPYNLLWWEDRLVIIDLPQAVEFVSNPDAFELLHRDLANVAGWFDRQGIGVDVEALYAELVAVAWLG